MYVRVVNSILFEMNNKDFESTMSITKMVKDKNHINIVVIWHLDSCLDRKKGATRTIYD